MKRYILYLGAAIVTIVMMVPACKKDLIMFNSSMDLVGFSSSSLSIKEDLGGPVSVKIYLGAESGAPATTVSLSIDTVGFGAAAAIEGTDFTLSATSVSVSVGETAVQVTPIDNSVFTGDKKFYIKITSNDQGYKISTQKKIQITISDDEHPLKTWIGTYSVDAASYGDPGNWDESWTVIASPVDGDVTKLSLQGVGDASADPVIATLDKDAMTITIEKGQNIGNVYGWGDVEIWFGFDDLSLDQNVNITGTLESDGTILIDNWGHLIKDAVDGDWVWDVFYTTWTK
jgi:hypothetical protein